MRANSIPHVWTGIALALFAGAGAVAQPVMYNYVTIAGSVSAGSADGSNINARFYYPMGVAVDAAGNVFVSDTQNHTIRQLTPAGTNWFSRTIAGVAGYPGSADGTNSQARFFNPWGICLDSAGNLLVADVYNHVIRRLSRSGSDWVSTTLAGLAGTSGSADGTNSDARFYYPGYVAAGNDGSVFVADLGNHTIRRLAPVGTNWVSSTIAGSVGQFGQGDFIDGTNTACIFGRVEGITLDPTGIIYVSDQVPNADWTLSGIRKIEHLGNDWVTTTIRREAWELLFGVRAAGIGSLYVSMQAGIEVMSDSGSNWSHSVIAGPGFGSADGTNATIQFNFPYGIAVDSGGNLYIADSENNTIRKLVALGTNWVSSTVAGLSPTGPSVDGTNTAAHFTQPQGIAVGTQGEIYVADTGAHAIREIQPVGTNWVTRTIAGTVGVPGSTDGTNGGALFNQPQGLALSADGQSLFVADTRNDTIRVLERVGSNWVSRTIAGNPGLQGSTDGTNSGALFLWPRGIAVGSSGELYVADTGNGTIRQLTLSGTNWISTRIAGTPGVGSSTGLAVPNGLALDLAGNIYIAEGWGAIRKLVNAGGSWQLSTVAGDVGMMEDCIDGTNTDALFTNPYGIAVDSAGNVYVADTDVRRLFELGTNWVSSTIGGSCGGSGSADGINGAAQFNWASCIAVDSGGNLYVADGVNNTIRIGTRLATNPPAPLLTGIGQQDGSLTLNWSATSGLFYQAQYSSSLDPTSWYNLGIRILATNASMFTSDPLTAPQRFYRMVLVP